MTPPGPRQGVDTQTDADPFCGLVDAGRHPSSTWPPRIQFDHP